MAVTGDIIRGYTDAIIMAQLLSKDSYGYEINKNVSIKTGGSFDMKEATLYTAFKRLEDAGYISSYWGNESVGARRKYYRLTKNGMENYNQRVIEWQSTKAILDSLMPKAGNRMEDIK